MRSAIAALVSASLLLAAAPAGARPADDVRVHLHRMAKVDPDGFVLGRVKVACPAGMEVLEALVTVSQDDQAIFGEGFIAAGECDGRRHRTTFGAQSYDAPFHAGEAYVSAYLLVVDPATDETLSAGDTRIIRLRTSP